MKSGHLLRQAINKLNAIDFNRQSERHQFNDLHEKILKDLQSAGNAGEFYTPRAVTQFMVDMVNPQLGEVTLDPATDTGGFLVCTIEHLRKQVHNTEQEALLQTSIRGVEKKQLPHMLCVTNLLFFTKGQPIRIEEFDAEKAWWGTEADGFASRVENERAWKVRIDTIRAAHWNRDQKNPHVGEQVSHDPEVLLADYARLQNEAQALRAELKTILAQSLMVKTAASA